MIRAAFTVAAAGLALCLAGPTLAQETAPRPRQNPSTGQSNLSADEQNRAASELPAGVARAEGALLRGLDKVTGQTRDLELKEGDSARLGLITVTLGECRYPADDPASNAYAWITILDDRANEPVFRGWMIAAAPALSALDHARYDVWVIRCSISGG
jgi:hypothetical protein